MPSSTSDSSKTSADKRGRDGIAVAEPLDVPGHHGERVAGAFACGPAADFDLTQCGNGGSEAQMGGAITRPSRMASRSAIGTCVSCETSISSIHF